MGDERTSDPQEAIDAKRADFILNVALEESELSLVMAGNGWWR